MIAATLNLFDLVFLHFFRCKHFILLLIRNELNSLGKRLFWLKMSETKLSPIIFTPWIENIMSDCNRVVVSTSHISTIEILYLGGCRHECLRRLHTELSAFIPAKAIDITYCSCYKGMILAAAHRGDFLSLELRNGRGGVSLVIIRWKPELPIVIAASWEYLSIILANEDAVVVAACSECHYFLAQSLDLFGHWETSEVALAKLPSLVKPEAVSAVILINANNVLAAIIGENLFDLDTFKLNLLQMAGPRPVFSGPIPVLGIFIRVIIRGVRLIIISDI